MTKEEKSRYSEPEALRDILKRVLSGRKFLLDCGHHVSFGSTLGKRHHHHQRQGAENHLLALRALNQRRCSMCDHDGLDWMDIALAGALAEEMAEEEKERERIRKEMRRREDVEKDKED